MLGAFKAGVMGASGGSGAEVISWDAGETSASHYTISNNGRDAQRIYDAGGAWDYSIGMDKRMGASDSGAYSVDLELLANSTTGRANLGMMKDSLDGNLGTWLSNSASGNHAGYQYSSGTVGDYFTIEFNGSTGAWQVFQNGSSIASGTVTVGGVDWLFAAGESAAGAKWRIVPQQYAPSSGYTKLEP